MLRRSSAAILHYKVSIADTPYNAQCNNKIVVLFLERTREDRQRRKMGNQLYILMPDEGRALRHLCTFA